MFSTRSFYNFCLAQNGIDKVPWAKLLWRGLVPSKVESMVWLAILDRLPTKVFLSLRGVLFLAEEIKCVLCGSNEETVTHLFIHCPWARFVWSAIFNGGM